MDNYNQISNKNMPKWKDATYKQLFTFPEMVADLIKGFIPNDIIDNFDQSTLTEESENHINFTLSEKREDKIWRLLTKGGNSFYLYILFEFQSFSDKEMALRVNEYSILFIKDLYKKKIIKRGEAHPPILPIVIYSGTKPWTAKTCCSELCQKTPPGLKKYQPEQHYFLLDIVRLVKESLLDEKKLASILFRMERCESIEELITEIENAKIRLKGDHYKEFRLILSQWIRYTVISQYNDMVSEDDKIISKLDLEEAKPVLSETIANIRNKDRDDAKQKSLLEVAIKMIKEGDSIEKISRITGINTEELLKIREAHAIS